MDLLTRCTCTSNVGKNGLYHRGKSDALTHDDGTLDRLVVATLIRCRHGLKLVSPDRRMRASSAAPTACASTLVVQPVENSRTGNLRRPMRTEPRQCQTSPRLR